jgi:hypothetical protein
MARKTLWVVALAAVVGLLAGGAPAFGQSLIFKSTAVGNPQVKSIDAIAFGPQGTLLIGDSKGQQVVAVQTGDTTARAWSKTEIAQIHEQLAGRIGTTGKGIEIIKMAVNPASTTAYFAIRKMDDKSSLILTVDGNGKISEFRLDNVKYARVSLPAGDKGPITKITDVTWAGDRVLVAAQANETFGSKIYSIVAPLENNSTGAIYSTETYHVSHGKWETRAPIKSVISYEEENRRYLVGAFTCTPIVKYQIDDLKPGDKVKGTSVIELGNGNHPLDMFTYQKNGKTYILMNTMRAFGKPFGPSKYWTVKVDHTILRENASINEKAVQPVPQKGKSEVARMVDGYHSVVHMDRLDATRALVIRTDDKGSWTLTVLDLP